MIEGLQHLTRGGQLPAIPAALSVAGLRLRGTLDHLYPAGRIEGRFARSSARHDLRAWLLHLVLCATAPPGVAPLSVQICRVDAKEGAAITCFRPVADPLAILEDLVQLFVVGQTRPLLLFPKAALTFVELVRKGKAPDEAVRQYTVQKEWSDELAHSHALQRIYGRDAELELHGPRSQPGRAPSSVEMDAALGFGAVARRVFEPMLDHLERLSLSDLAAAGVTPTGSSGDGGTRADV
jgi:exonuclease V gamma subunit